MSRHTTIITNEDGRTSLLNYGCDHALGYWIDELWGRPDDDEDECIWECSENIDSLEAVKAKYEEYKEFIPPKYYEAFRKGEQF